MSPTLPPELEAALAAYRSGGLSRTGLEAQLEAWREAHPEQAGFTEDLLAGLPPADSAAEATRIQSPEEAATTVPPAPANAGATRIRTEAGAGEGARAFAAAPETETRLRGEPTGGQDAATAPPAVEAAAAGGVAGVGSVLQHRFVLEELIARGGMGVVFKARDLRKEEAHDREPFVAIKVLTEDFKRHPDSLIALQREAKKAQQLAHPNTVTVYDFDRDGETVYMTMELLQGESLSEVIKRYQPRGLPLDEALHVIEGVTQGLAYAHQQGIVHSDLKPGNIFITHKGTVKVLDFGIARAVRRPGQRQQDATLFDPGALGALTPAYASCEMIEGGDPDPRDDVYALACVAYELIAGRHPFGRLQATQARDNRITPQAPPGLGRAQWHGLLRGLSFERDERTPDVNEFFAELSGRRTAEMRARRWPWIGGALAAALALAGGLLWVMLPAPAPTPPGGPAQTQESPEPAPMDPETQSKVQDLLEIAEAHRLVGRLFEPPGSNAYDVYEQVLELHPHDRMAEAGLMQIADELYARAEEAYAAGRKAEAARLVAKGLKVRPGHAGLLRLQEGLAADGDPSSR